MESKSIRGLMLVAVTALVLAGCSSSKTKEAPPEPVAPTPVQKVQPTPEPVVQRPVIRASRMVLEDGEELQGVFYFDFDQAIVKREGHAELNKHGRVLSEDRSFRVRIEGHADERGTREYNLALGERRANAIMAYLQAQGALASQMEVVSYGEERPAVDGHSESAWSKNRRVEIVYK